MIRVSGLADDIVAKGTEAGINVSVRFDQPSTLPLVNRTEANSAAPVRLLDAPMIAGGTLSLRL